MLKEDTALGGPGGYRPDPPAGRTAIADLPPPQRASLPSAPPRAQRVRGVGPSPLDTSSTSGGCTIWASATSGVHAISSGPMRSPPVRSVARTFTRPALLWRHPALRTPPAGWLWRDGGWSQMAGPTGPHVGPSGATTAS